MNHVNELLAKLVTMIKFCNLSSGQSFQSIVQDNAGWYFCVLCNESPQRSFDEGCLYLFEHLVRF